MTVETMTLTDFLLARLDEDEDAIRWDIQCGESFTIDPGRMLATIAAHRRIVEVFEDDFSDSGWYYEDKVLRALASVYADHEAFREEWR